MNKKIALGILVLVITVGTGIFFIKGISTEENKFPEKEERLLRVITENTPGLLYNNLPVIEIESISTFNNKWHVVTIKSLRSSGKLVPVKLILLDEKDTSHIIAGPDTHFVESELLKLNAPDSVIMELQKS